MEYHRCIGNFFRDDAIGWIEFHQKWDQGVMPYPGAYADQPAKVIEIMRVIGNYKLNWQTEQAKKEALKSKMRGGRHGR